MTIQTKLARIPVFLVLGGVSAVLFGFMTGARKLAGWTLAVWGIGLLVESLGLSHHLRHPDGISRGKNIPKEYLTAAGILAVSIIPVLDFLFLPALLPRTQGMQEAGLILVALGLLFLIRAKISWEYWTRDEVLDPAIRREINSGPNHANRFLEITGVGLWAVGIGAGYGSLAGIVAAIALLVPGILPQKPREAGKQ
ncbi:MAG: hypothetical protein WBM17_05725 [Anaerolineales bacterium]